METYFLAADQRQDTFLEDWVASANVASFETRGDGLSPIRLAPLSPDWKHVEFECRSPKLGAIEITFIDEDELTPERKRLIEEALIDPIKKEYMRFVASIPGRNFVKFMTSGWITKP